MGPVVINQVDWTHPDATSLRDAQQLEIDGLREVGNGTPASSANVPVFLVAYDELEPVACGGLRPLSSQGLPGQAEIKRMYAVPSRRGSGEGQPVVALSVLKALEGVAKEHEWTVLKVETSVLMGQARRFYEKHGYVTCEVFGGYKFSSQSAYYEKRLL